MALLQALFHLTDFKNPLLRTAVPTLSAAFILQAAFAVPSIIARSERFYDFSGALTFLSCTALSLYVPYVHPRGLATGLGPDQPPTPASPSPFTSSGDGVALHWRQVVLSTAVAIWALRLGSYLFRRILSEGADSRFDKIKTKPAQFSIAFLGQAVWVSCCLLPVLAVNATPQAALAAVPPATTDVIGLGLWLGGFVFESIADHQKHRWLQDRKAKLHDEQFITRGLWSRSQFPHYFGEITLWTGLAVAAAGTLVSSPVQSALGFGGSLTGPLAAVTLSAVCPLFVAFLLLKISGVPLSEQKYDQKYGNKPEYQRWKESTPKIIPRLW